jgi:chromosome partitioning protein
MVSTTQTTSTRHIAVALQKGGVGKTLVSINVAGALSNRGHNVLFVDTDPQGNATEGLGFADVYLEDPPHLASILTGGDGELTDIVLEHDEMDVIPSNIDMFTAEAELVSAMQGRRRLERAVDGLLNEQAYDFVIYDTPPSLLIMTDSALLAAENVLIPALAEETSTRALDILFQQIDTIEEQYQRTIREVGIVANRVEPDGEAKRMMEWFDDTFGDTVPVFEVRKRVALKRAWNNSVSIFEHDESSDMEAVFTDIATQLEETV